MPTTSRSSATTKRSKRPRAPKKSSSGALDPIPPGEILLEEFMKPLDVSQNRLARDIDVPSARISDIVHGRRAITADTALRLAKFFGTSPDLWMGLQVEFDLRRAKREVWPKVEGRVRPHHAA